jgi:hypothetical protein
MLFSQFVVSSHIMYQNIYVFEGLIQDMSRRFIDEFRERRVDIFIAALC